MKAKSFLTLLSFCLLFLLPLSLCAQEPVCGKCYKKKSLCPYSCNHPKCKTCGKFCGARVDPCPYGGKHPKCSVCGKLKENCAYKGNHPKCNTCGELRENCSYGGHHPTTGTHAGHEWVDLGLSVKWATCNVGANSPEEYDNYYAWGETSTKSSYDDDNCKTWERSMSDIRGNSSYDAARANWGGSWRLPTMAECEELRNNCYYKWTTQNGVKGMRFTSKRNGNSIFLPAAGWRDGTSTDYVGEDGYYCSSTPYESNSQHAYGLYIFSRDSAGTHWYSRDRGKPVRPVLE